MCATLTVEVAAQEVSVDTTFNSGDIGFGNGDGFSGGSPSTIALQPDGKVICVGMGGVYNGTHLFGIVRLDTNGHVDGAFDGGLGAYPILATAVQPDAKVLIAGGFVNFNGTLTPGVARLNNDGSLDGSFDPGLGGGSVFSMALQPDGKILLGGGFTSFGGVQSKRITRLLANGSPDTLFDTGLGFDAWVHDLVLQPDGKVLVSGDFTEYNGVGRNGIARVNADGSLDASFEPSTGPDTLIKSIALQPDGKILIGGHFTSFDGTSRNRIARLQPDGSLDTSFDPGAGASGAVLSVAVQPDGKILIVGYFTSYDSIPSSGIARLNVDGTLDSTFNPGTGVLGPPKNVLVQTNGKILIAGGIFSYDGTSRSGIARLNDDGSLDFDFNRGSGANSDVTDLAALPDGQILVAGSFTTYNGTPVNGITRVDNEGSIDSTFLHGTDMGAYVQQFDLHGDGRILMVGGFVPCPGMPGGACEYIDRLNPDGSQDTTFIPGSGANNWIYCCSIQPDEKIIIAGIFTSYDSTARNHIARLNFDGGLDPSFDPGTGADYNIYSIAVQPDGKILIGGDFNVFDGFNRPGIARLHADGSVDTSFDPGSGPNGRTYSIVPQPDGKILIGGLFTSYDGTTSNRIARVNPDGTIDPSFEPGNGASGWVSAILLEPDGHVMLFGDFWSYDNTLRPGIARINPDGSLDPSYDPGDGADESILSAAKDQQNRLLIGGEFTSFNGIGRNRVARLIGDGSVAVQELSGTAMGLWPNPATTTLNLPAPLDVTVFDAQGRVVISAMKHTRALAIDGLYPGAYMVRERSGKTAWFIKH